MRFDRTPPSSLLGDLVALSSRFNGDTTRARQFQQDNQGLFILRALRESGYEGPVVLSYDTNTDRWTSLPAPYVPTMDHRALVRGSGWAFVVGGMEDGQRVTAGVRRIPVLSLLGN